MEILVNYMEHLVNEQMDEYLRMNPDICSCDKCKIDMKAHSLNKLKPQYVVSDKGYIYQKIEEMRLQYRVDILKAIIDASKIVSKNPRHEEI